jgi:soluble lytic murein transglycosylase-like protein
MIPLPASRPIACARRAHASRIAAVILASGFASPLDAAPSATCSDYLAEAAQVSGLPESLIAAVLHVESRGSSAAISSAGAKGCMQIMPATWGSLTARYALGADVHDPRANMIGGALYLREMVDRYGLQGGLAAYNAGPGRYEAWRDGRRNLPRETINYVAQIAPVSGGNAAPLRPLFAATIAPSWKQSSIFVTFTRATSTAKDIPTASDVTTAILPALRLSFEPLSHAASTLAQPDLASSAPSKSGLFANIEGQ